MEDSLTPPQVAFVVHLQGAGAAKADVARTMHVAHLFRMHRLPCTWSLSGCCSLEIMQHKGLLGSAAELALALDVEGHSKPQSGPFRATLRQRMEAIRTCSGIKVELLSGNPEVLRTHAAILAEQAVRGVINEQTGGRRASLTPLPCGLWQINCGAQIPERTWIARLLSRGSAALRQVARLQATAAPLVVAIDAAAIARSRPRQLQQLDNLLRQVSLAASRGQMQVVTAGELLAGLGSKRSRRPQQSILRAA